MGKGRFLMIRQAAYYVRAPEEGAYLSQSQRFWIRPFNPRNPGGYTRKSIGLFSLDEAKAILADLPDAWGKPKIPIEIWRAPRCQCCGKDEFRAQLVDPTEGPWRCYDHRDRNPCAIEGCTRTRAAPENSEFPDPFNRLRTDQWLCSTHWRRFAPPRSVRRRAYHAFFRRAKRHGWDNDLRRQFWRFWDQLVKTARAKATEGSIDKTAIDKLFGWD